MKHIAVVDGGASRCRLAVFSEGGKLLARAEIEAHASLTMGVGIAWQHIAQGLRLLQQSLKEKSAWQPDVLCMGLAGALQEQKRAEFLALVPKGVEARLHTDGYAQLIGAAGGQPGICLAVGTGSVMHWLDGAGQQGMAGGWGFPVGDQGSGAWLGMRLLQVYVAHRDGDVSDSSLIDSVEQRVGSSVADIQRWTTENRSSVLAQLAPLIFESAAAGDKLALALIDEAVSHCMELVRLAPDSLPVYVVGGVGTQISPALSVLLGNRLQKSCGDALRGLWHLAAAPSSKLD